MPLISNLLRKPGIWYGFPSTAIYEKGNSSRIIILPQYPESNHSPYLCGLFEPPPPPLSRVWFVLLPLWAVWTPHYPESGSSSYLCGLSEPPIIQSLVRPPTSVGCLNPPLSRVWFVPQPLSSPCRGPPMAQEGPRPNSCNIMPGSMSLKFYLTPTPIPFSVGVQGS